MTSAFISGCSGPELTPGEIAFFRDAKPAGLILFARNCESPDQVRRLTDAFRNAVGAGDTLVLIDQEGGRVQRLVPPHWRALPPAAAFGALYAGNPDKARRAASLAARLTARDLLSLGVNMNCAPVLDLPVPGSHGIIGDRAYGTSAEIVAALGRSVAEGLIFGGVLPVIKHIPGHGRARSDSHLELPVVDTSMAELEAQDFAPFKRLADMPAAMTAHVVFTAIDAKAPATTSLAVVQDVIRDLIGFDGLLMSDDLGMKALQGPMAERTEQALFAGCDVALHCNGNLDEMRQVAEAAEGMETEARFRYARCLALLGGNQPFDVAEAEALLAEVLAMS